MDPRETELIPNYGLYRFMGAISDPALAALGGYAAHNVEALRPVEGQAVFIGPDHRANIDSFVIGLILYNLHNLTASSSEKALNPRVIHYMAKDTLWRWPIVKQVVQGCGAFPVKRYQGVGLQQEQVDHVAKLVDNKAAMCIYPEGTRNHADVSHVHREKLKTTIAYLALKHGVPIVPVGIAGAQGLSKLPREAVFGEAIWVPKREDVDSAEFKSAKNELMDELHTQIETNYQAARQHLAARLATA